MQPRNARVRVLGPGPGLGLGLGLEPRGHLAGVCRFKVSAMVRVRVRERDS